MGALTPPYLRLFACILRAVAPGIEEAAYRLRMNRFQQAVILRSARAQAVGDSARSGARFREELDDNTSLNSSQAHRDILYWSVEGLVDYQ